MTGKLMKYEIRSSVKTISVIWAALLAASILLGLFGMVFRRVLPGDISDNDLLELLGNLSGFVYVAIFAALVVVTVMIVVLRFYKGLLGDEGYLMHTLPVKPWQLITAKGLVAAGVVVASILTATLSLFILFGMQDPTGVRVFCESIFDMFRFDGKIFIVAAELLVVLILSLLKSIYQIYASMAIGQLAGKHRVLLSLGAYIGISTILMILASIGIVLIDLTGLGYWLSEEAFFYNIGSAFAVSQYVVALIFLATAVQLAAFHIVTERILAKRLNLQ